MGALLSLLKLKSNRRRKPNEIGSMGEIAREIPEFSLYLTLLAFNFPGLWVKRESRNKRAAYFPQVFLVFCFLFLFLVVFFGLFFLISHLCRLSLLWQSQTVEEWQGTQSGDFRWKFREWGVTYIFFLHTDWIEDGYFRKHWSFKSSLSCLMFPLPWEARWCTVLSEFAL